MELGLVQDTNQRPVRGDPGLVASTQTRHSPRFSIPVAIPLCLMSVPHISKPQYTTVAAHASVRAVAAPARI